MKGTAVNFETSSASQHVKSLFQPRQTSLYFTLLNSMGFLLAKSSSFSRSVWVGILAFSMSVTHTNLPLAGNLLGNILPLLRVLMMKFSSVLQIPESIHELLHSSPVKAGATTVPSSLHLSSFLQFLNVPNSFLELATTTTKTTKNISDPSKWNAHWSSISVFYFPISC